MGSDATGFSTGKKIYTAGGYSGPYAVLRITNGRFRRIAAGTNVTGTDSTKSKSIVGTVITKKGLLDRHIRVAYNVNTNTSTCQVGGLSSSAKSVKGCFAASGIVQIGNRNVEYSYDPLTKNYNYRTLQKFSTSAGSQYKIAGQYFPLFKKYVAYYGITNFGDAIISKALDGKFESFASKGIVYNFTKYGFAARSEVVGKGIQFLIVLIQIVYELEMSITTCSECNGTGQDCQSLYAVDKAVAYYVGSLESSDGKPMGVTLFQLADTRCTTFRTCGVNGASTTGRSQANFVVMDLFQQLRAALVNRKCTEATALKDKITQKLYIPLLQSTIRALYNTAVLSTSTEVSEAEGFISSIAVAPVLASCNNADATTLVTNMRIGQNRTASITGVKAALENNYGCLGITCAEIGGIWAGSSYRQGFAPCK